MKALILIAAGLLSSGAIAQSTMGNMSMPKSGATTAGVTKEVKTTTMHRTGKVTHSGMKSRHHRMAMHHRCPMRMHNGKKMRMCSSHMKKPMHHRTTTMHSKVTVTKKTSM